MRTFEKISFEQFKKDIGDDKELYDSLKLPSRETKYAAGYDLYADEDATIWPETNELIHTGIAIEIPEGYFGAIYARSGLASKQSLRPANCVGVIDSDYRGQVCVCIHNDNPYRVVQISEEEGRPLISAPIQDREIKKGDRIAQLVIQKFEPVTFEEVDELSETVRGEGGFGSTGKN